MQRCTHLAQHARDDVFGFGRSALWEEYRWVRIEEQRAYVNTLRRSDFERVAGDDIRRRANDV